MTNEDPQNDAWIPLCPDCLQLVEGGDDCPLCGQSLPRINALLKISLDRITDKDRSLIEEVTADWTAGEVDWDKRTLTIRTPEEWGGLRKSALRMLSRNGTTIQGPSGVSLEPKDPILECLATRKTSALRSCISQGLGDSLCSHLAGLLPLAEDARGHYSLSDGLQELGLDPAPFIRGVIRTMDSDEASNLRCPEFARAVTSLGSEPPEKLHLIPIPGEGADWEVSRGDLPDSQAMKIVDGQTSGATWGVALDDCVLVSSDEGTAVMAPQGVELSAPPSPGRHAGDLVVLVPSRWQLFWHRYSSEGRRADDVCTWMLPQEGGPYLRQMPDLLWGLGSFGSLPIGPASLLTVTPHRLTLAWQDDDREPIVVQREELRGERWSMKSLSDEHCLIWSDEGDVLLIEQQLIWRISPSRPGERWPVQPWYSSMFDGINGVVPLGSGRFAILSSGGHRLSLLQAGAVRNDDLDGTPSVKVLDDMALPNPAGSMASSRSGRLILATEAAVLELDCTGRTCRVMPLQEGQRALALGGGAWMIGDAEGWSMYGEGRASEADFGSDLGEFLGEMGACAQTASKVRVRRAALIENLYTLERRRARRARRGGL